MLKLLGLVFSLLLLTACGQPPRDYVKPGGADSRSATSSTAPASCLGTSYTVELNDNLGVIALRCGVSLNQLIGVNHLTPPYIIYPKQELIIPRDPLASPGAQLGAQSANWRWPIDHKTDYLYVLDSAGIQGLEVYAEVGTLVRAVADGDVAFAEASTGPLGTMVMIRHANNYLSIYSHNQRLQVQQGDRVKAGDVIAHLGQTGRTDRPKLYFEIRHQGRKIAVEPLLGRP